MMLHDIFPHTLNNHYENKAVQPEDTVVVFADRQALVCGALGEEIRLPRWSQLEQQVSADDLRYAFSVDETNYFLLLGDTRNVALEGFRLVPITQFRQVFSPKGKQLYFALMTAWHLYGWYQDTRCCGRCGQPLVHSDTLRMLSCPSCGSMAFPKIAPAVIIGLTDGDRILMSKYAGRDFTGYSLLAGFVEIGETPEQTVAREVREEVGLKAKHVRYYKSQPGGIDSNLLLGFFCDLDGTDEVDLDREELSLARWYHREDIPVGNDEYTLTYEMIDFFKNHPEAFSK